MTGIDGFGTINGDGMRYLLLREIDAMGFPPYGVLLETLEGGARLHVFGATAGDHGLCESYDDFDAAIRTVGRNWLVTAAGREGFEHRVGARTDLDPPETSRLESDWIGKPVEAGRKSPSRCRRKVSARGTPQDP